jgi:hypothetical protein
LSAKLVPTLTNRGVSRGQRHGSLICLEHGEEKYFRKGISSVLKRLIDRAYIQILKSFDLFVRNFGFRNIGNNRAINSNFD